MANVVEAGVCQACERTLPLQQGRGRVRRYCNAQCRDAARRGRERSARYEPQDAKDSLTRIKRHANLDTRESLPGAGDRVAAEIGETARRLLDELDHPGSPDGAVVAARDLLAVAEAALRAAVDRARAGGRSWRDIGDALGTSRQAAFQRFGHPVDPRTGVAMTRTVPPGAVEQATEFLACFTASRWEEVLGYFDDHMRERHDAGRLAGGWAQMIGMFGSYEGTGQISPVAAGEGSVVDVRLRFEAGEAMLMVRFDDGGRVTGLRLHPTSS